MADVLWLDDRQSTRAQEHNAPWVELALILCLFGALFLVLGVLLFLDRVLLALGNVPSGRAYTRRAVDCPGGRAAAVAIARRLPPAHRQVAPPRPLMPRTACRYYLQHRTVPSLTIVAGLLGMLALGMHPLLAMAVEAYGIYQLFRYTGVYC